MQEDNKVRNVELAYLGLCLKGVQPNELNLTQEVLSIGRMTSDTSLAMTVQDSIRLLVVVKGIELEESSQRYALLFRQCPKIMTRRFVQSAWTIAMGRSCVTSGRKTS